jgi:two-component system, NtrC family, sensor kinase
MSGPAVLDTPLSSTPRHTPWALTLLLVASVVGPLTIAALVSWQQYVYAQREAYAQVRSTLGLLHEHAQRVFEIYELALGRVADRIEGLSWPEIEARAPTLQLDFNRLKQGVDEIGSLLLLDPQGRLVVSASNFKPGIDNSDRDYYRALVDSDPGTFIDQAVLGRVSGRVIFNVSRRRPAPDGRFDGVIALASEQDYWLRFYATLDQELSPSVNLVRAEGDTLIRFPRIELGQAKPSEQFMQSIRAHSEDYYEVVSRADGSRRIIGYRKLADYPVYVVYTVSKDAVVAKWREDAVMFGLAALGVIAALLPITLLLRQRILRERQLQGALAEANRTLESNVAQRTEELSRALREKDVLLREVHHRVKNNLQMIASLVRISGRNHPAGQHPIRDDVTRRIIAVGQVYDQVHKADDLSQLDLGAYLRSICNQLTTAIGRSGVALQMRLEPIMVNIDTALPVGLIAQELVTNAFKYGLAGDGAAEIVVKLAREDDHAILTVRDNGRGLPADGASVGTGLRLVTRLTDQVDGRFRSGANPGGGAYFRVTFPLSARA